MALKDDVYNLYSNNIGGVTNIRTAIEEYKEMFNLDLDPSVKIGSKIGLKQVLTLISNLKRPFKDRNNICVIEPERADAEYKAKIDELLINNIWQNDKQIKQKIANMVNYIVIEGTAFVETGWNYVVEDEIIYKGKALDDKDFFKDKKINKLDNGEIEIVQEKIIKNEPFIEVYSIDNVVFDVESPFLTWIIFEFETTVEELAQMGYGKNTIRTLKRYLQNDKIETVYKADDLNKTRFKLYKYYGYDDNNKPILAYFVNEGNGFSQIKKIENLLHLDTIPVVNIKLYDIANKINGYPLLWAIYQEEKLNTAIKKAIVDNLHNSNYDKVFYKKGSLSEGQLKNYLNGKPLIEVNTRGTIREAIEFGTFNPLPNYIFSLLNMTDSESSGITGVNQYIQGSISSDVKLPATNFNALASQTNVRIEDFINNIVDGLKLIFTIWTQMFGNFYTDEDIQEITGINLNNVRKHQLESKIKEFGIEQLSEQDRAKVKLFLANQIEEMMNLKNVKYRIEIKVGSDGLKQIRIQNDLMLIQQLSPLANTGAIGIEHIKMILADLAENMDRDKLAKEILRYQPQPDPMQQELAKAEIAEKQGKAQKEQALAQNAIARTDLTIAKSQKELGSIEPDIAKKYTEIAVMAKQAKEGTNENNGQTK